MAKTTARPDKPAPHKPDELEQALLNDLQTDFPLVAEPWAELAARHGCPAAEVLSRLETLKQGQIIRQISAIFDSRQLGYRSSLVAMEFPPDELEAGAAVINLHPGVSHNYKRNHQYNLWFTIAVPPGRTLEHEVGVLAERARPIKTWLLPTIKLFKIGVNLDATGKSAVTATEEESSNIGLRSAKAWQQGDGRAPELSPGELAAIRLLQADLPLVERPFEALCSGAAIDSAELLGHAASFLKRRLMRRYAAVLHHRKAGFTANAMGVWVVPPEQIEEVGRQMAAFRAVSHCYQRPTYSDWPYSVFTMIHARKGHECEEVAEAISAATGITDYTMLYSTKEYKKTRVRYFLDDDAFAVESIPARG